MNRIPNNDEKMPMRILRSHILPRFVVSERPLKLLSLFLSLFLSRNALHLEATSSSTNLPRRQTASTSIPTSTLRDHCTPSHVIHSIPTKDDHPRVTRPRPRNKPNHASLPSRRTRTLPRRSHEIIALRFRRRSHAHGPPRMPRPPPRPRHVVVLEQRAGADPAVRPTQKRLVRRGRGRGGRHASDSGFCVVRGACRFCVRRLVVFFTKPSLRLVGQGGMLGASFRFVEGGGRRGRRDFELEGMRRGLRRDVEAV